MTNKIRARNSAQRRILKPTSIYAAAAAAATAPATAAAIVTETETASVATKSHATKHMLICLILAAIYAFGMKVKIMECMSITRKIIMPKELTDKICLEKNSLFYNE